MTDGSGSAIRRGAVAVITRGECLLVIRRSAHVTAPGKYCFPGGGIEEGESEEQALVREMREELDANITPLRPIWRNVTSWGIDLSWWLAELEPGELRPNPAEVESVHWFTREELRRLDGLLDSNRQFLARLASNVTLREYFDLD